MKTRASKVKTKHPIEYQEINDVKYLLLKRDWLKVKMETEIKKQKIPKTERCPFCGNYHSHAIGAGHRLSHCGFPPLKTCIANDGSILNSKDGYIIVDLNANFLFKLD